MARLFRARADLIDQDPVGGRLWDDDGAVLLAAAYAFHTGLSRRAAVAAHVSAWRSRAR
jgi:hypothetical protein